MINTSQCTCKLNTFVNLLQQERIAEKQAKRKAELEEKRRKAAENEVDLTPEEEAARKERARLQEEEDQLMLAKDLMGQLVEQNN